MPTPRSRIVDENSVGTYHCISRCVRKARLCGKGRDHRRSWIERQIADLQQDMAIDIVAWNVLSNHLHVVVTIRPDLAASWSDQEVAERYYRMCPGLWRRRKKGIPEDAPRTPEELAEITANPARLAAIRKRLSSLSWFMRQLKGSISRLANREDDCTGAFWEQRFRSIRILDDAALLATAVYVDLNAVRAGMVDRPEKTPHGSISERAAMVAGLPRRTGIRLAAAPMATEAAYLEHVDRWGRLLAPGKASISAKFPPILRRLGLTRRRWTDLLKAGWDSTRGTVIGTDAARRQEAARRGGHWVIDLIAAPSIA